MTPEHARASQWAEANGFTGTAGRERLSELTGYSGLSIWWFFKGQVPPSRGAKRKPKPWVWLRFKRACGDIDAEIRGRKAGSRFDW